MRKLFSDSFRHLRNPSPEEFKAEEDAAFERSQRIQSIGTAKAKANYEKMVADELSTEIKKTAKRKHKRKLQRDARKVTRQSRK